MRAGPANRSWYPHYNTRSVDCKWQSMMIQDRPPRYGSYLLRYWEVRSDLPGQPSTWRFTLEEAGTGKRHAFSDLGALLAHLARALAVDDAVAASQENQHE